MPNSDEQFIQKLNTVRKDHHRLWRIVTTLSFVVIFAVFWSLKLTGIGIAGEAFCGKDEHVHSETCIQKTLICTLEETEAHVHSEECLEKVLTCSTEEDGHVHTEACYTVASGFICGETEENGHVHTSACITDETRFSCEKEATPGHVHTEACYKTEGSCKLEEHTHTATCYSDITADLETAEDWEMTLAGLTRGPTTRENVILVARSQLGYKESTLNFTVDEKGVQRGITRYGQWYGNPYGDWSAMFVSFCLSYAGADELPTNAGVEAMRLEWEAAEMYLSKENGSPRPGDLLFLKKDGESTAAAAVAIITSVEEGSLTVIRGDAEDAVAEEQYAADDPLILGYGTVPNGEEIAVLATGERIAQTVDYSSEIFAEDRMFVVYTTVGNEHFAFDGNGNAVPVTIDSEGNIYSQLADPDTLLWSFSAQGTDTYLIQNVKTGRYMHSYSNNGADVTTSGAYSSRLIQSGTGVLVRSNNDYSVLNSAHSAFTVTQTQSAASVYRFGFTSRCTVWLDGTDGGLGHLTGSPDTGYSVSVGSVMKLPTEWTSPAKYSYRLRGWYDVTNAKYYAPGAEMTVTGNAVLYADWIASTYDIGQFNAQVANTVSTASFMTTQMFDYNYLFNIHSSKVECNVTAAGHSETWSMVTSGTVAHQNAQTENFIFVDNDSGGLLCIPNNRSSLNVYPGAGIVTPGIYSDRIGKLLFATDNIYDPATGSGVIGKTYLGTGDHLFQIMDDPDDEHYGYYYYDSKHNAASYNQSRGRFYVYDYLSATSDAIGSTNSDFLPLNSPYANTAGKTVGTYNYSGVDGEYQGVPHYRYDSKYNSGNYNSPDNVQTDYAYGMKTDIKFYLPNDPGTDGNKDLYGNDMQFSFSGDDDLWVLIDGQLVLDIGGIHGAEDGTIDFSTGTVTVQGEAQTSLMDLGITAGDHTMTVLYLERGSSLSNCSIYFNLAPRFGMELKKEDVLTRELLDGTKFTVYTDPDCTEPATLWESEAAYNEDLADGVLDASRSTFTIVNGTTSLWGLGSGNTYYIKETGAPAAAEYGLPRGVIRLTIEKGGLATYRAEVIDEADGTAPSPGFTVHGVRIDEETKTVYLTVTNAPESVKDTTMVQVLKKWEDSADHSADYVQAYLTVTDSDGTVRRIREITLSDENEWMYVWTNLPEYDYDAMTKVQYGVEESYESGYYSTVRKITDIIITTEKWAEALSFKDKETYILGGSRGYLSTSDAQTTSPFKWVDEQTAQSSPNAQWTATVSGSSIKFVNGLGQILTFNYGNSSSSRYFYATKNSSTYQSFTMAEAGDGFHLYATRSNRKYYLSTNSINSSGRIPATNYSSAALAFRPMCLKTQETVEPAGDWAYQITNTPLEKDNETFLAVKKEWSLPPGYSASVYEEFAVTVRLLANGTDTGRTLTLTLKNNWEGSFLGLPYKDSSGNVITYSVTENWSKSKWSTHYGPITSSGASPPTYNTVITNTYHPGGPELPSTGSAARLHYILCGSGLMLGSLVYGIGSRRKRERRLR